MPDFSDEYLGRGIQRNNKNTERITPSRRCCGVQNERASAKPWVLAVSRGLREVAASRQLTMNRRYANDASAAGLLHFGNCVLRSLRVAATPAQERQSNGTALSSSVDSDVQDSDF
jgi:hypothetical protein